MKNLKALLLILTCVSFTSGCGIVTSFKAYDHNKDSLDVGTGQAGGSSAADLNGGGVDAGGNVILASTKTVGVPILTQTYASLTSALQISSPSQATRAEYTNQSVNFSESGQPKEVGAPFTLSLTTLAAAICLDRINLELSQQNAQKMIFTNINLNQAPGNNNANESNLSVTINRLARTLWQRNETEAELAILLAAVNESMGLDNGNNAAETRDAALFLCTAMASSTSGIQL